MRQAQTDETKSNKTQGTLSDLFPEATREMTNEIGNAIISPFNCFRALNLCAPILEVIMTKGTKEEQDEVEKMLNTIHIELVERDGKFVGTGLHINNLSISVLERYSPFTVEHSICCMFIGKLQQKMADYRGPSDDMDIMDQLLSMAAASLAKTGSVKDCMDHMKSIVNKGKSNSND